MEYCCTCTTTLQPPSQPPPPSSEPPEEQQPLPKNRRVQCCARIICGKCIHHNRRFADYCPYCQVSNVPSTLPQGLKDPPSYTPVPRAGARTVVQAGPPPPPYVTDPGVVEEDEEEEEGDGEELDEKELLRREEAREEKRRAKAAVTSTPTPPRDFDPDDEKAEPAEDTLHFVDHEHDSINSLSLRYNVPATALRRANNITSDHLLLARRTVVIPGEFYKTGVSLSPRPIGGEEEEQRKGRIRRFMTSCKVADYDVALLYLEQTGYDVEAAADAYFDDEAWERAHPSQSSSSRKEGTSKKPSLWSRLRK